MKNLVRMGRIIALFAVTLFVVFGIPKNVQANGGMNVYSIYLGTTSEEGEEARGDATLIESNGNYLLMDVGTKGAYPLIRDFLKNKGVTNLSVYLSHFHTDHTGGLTRTYSTSVNSGLNYLFQDFQVDKVYLPSSAYATENNTDGYYKNVNKLYQEQYPSANLNQSIIELGVGSAFMVGAAHVSIIGPVRMNGYTMSNIEGYSSDSRRKAAYINNYSLVARITCENTVFLTAGDIEQLQESLLIQEYGDSGVLNADLYKMSHHGNYMSNSAEFLEKVTPDVIFATNNGNAAGLNSSGTNRVVASSLYNSNQYGFCYLLGDEKKSVGYQINGSRIQAFRTNGSSQSAMSGLVKVDGADGVNRSYDYYLLDGNGKPLKGIQTVNGQKYYFGPGGCRDYGTYSNGVYQPFRKYTVNGSSKSRYFDNSSNVMQTGWLDYGNNFYYFDDEGYMLTGMKTIAGNKYFFDKNGIRTTSKTLSISGVAYAFDQNGVAQKANSYSKKSGIYNSETGQRARGLTKIGSKYYYLYSNGNYAKNKSVTVSKTTLRFDQKGVCINVPKANPVVVTKLTAQKGKITARWSKSAKASYYKIYVSTKKNSGYQLVAQVNANKSLKYQIQGLNPNKRYYVKIKACREVGDITFTSSYSNVRNIRTK